MNETPTALIDQFIRLSQVGTNAILLVGIYTLWKQFTTLLTQQTELLRECVAALTKVYEHMRDHGDA